MKIGVEVLPLQCWPGYQQADSKKAEDYATEIAQTWEEHHPTDLQGDDTARDSYEKAEPESEALLVVENERKGIYNAISETDTASNSWFISYTSILNLVANDRITWQPDAFLSFASTLCNVTSAEAADKAFGVVLIGLARSGLSMLDDDLLARVFGSPIDQTKLSIEALKDSYANTIEQKYGESIESVMQRVKAIEKPLAVVQLSREIAEVALRQQQLALEQRQNMASKLTTATQELSAAHEKLKAADRYKARYLDKRRRALQKKRRAQSRKPKKR